MSDCIRENKKDYYMVRSAKNRKILPLQTKYLKYKTECNLSTNTVKRSAYILTFYMDYMHEKEITIDEVFALPYLAQQEHFKDFLFYIKAGCHTGTEKVPLNNTCNAYLKEVFEFYEFLIMEYEKYDNLKVLKDAQVTYKTSYGAIFKKTVHDTLVQVYVINNESEEVNDILRVKELSGREYDVYIELKDGVMKIDKKL